MILTVESADEILKYDNGANGKRAVWNYRIMDQARGRLLSVRGLVECLAFLPSASITRWLRRCEFPGLANNQRAL